MKLLRRLHNSPNAVRLLQRMDDFPTKCGSCSMVATQTRIGSFSRFPVRPYTCFTSATVDANHWPDQEQKNEIKIYYQET